MEQVSTPGRRIGATHGEACRPAQPCNASSPSHAAHPSASTRGARCQCAPRHSAPLFIKPARLASDLFGRRGAQQQASAAGTAGRQAGRQAGRRAGRRAGRQAGTAGGPAAACTKGAAARPVQSATQAAVEPGRQAGMRRTAASHDPNEMGGAVRAGGQPRGEAGQRDEAGGRPAGEVWVGVWVSGGWGVGGLLGAHALAGACMCRLGMRQAIACSRRAQRVG